MRKSGILMHITSLPGSYGVGTMGKAAYDFVDFLKESGQRVWQILPLTPTGYGDSPYQSCSAYAGNHYLIDLDLLVEEGLLLKEEADAPDWGEWEDRVDFGKLYANRLFVLEKAFDRFREEAALDAFCQEKRQWLRDFALYMALKEERLGAPWYEWEAPLKFREADALEQARNRLQRKIRFYCFIQYLFDRQWQALRAYAREAGVQIMGDVPIYVPLDSCEVWTEPELFWLDEERKPVCVAGCPPDAFTEDGQLWGNPLYRWDVHGQDGYRWWIRRLAAANERYDKIRLDHFRGFESYWAVPFGDATARHGKWLKGPGMDFIAAIRQALPQVPMVAEDLGYLTEEVIRLKEASGYPGMKILLFAFDSREPSDYAPHNYTANSVCYTGTHDNMTTRQWYESAELVSAAYAAEYVHQASGESFVWSMIRAAMASVSDLCVIPMQDYLELGVQGRMNNPGTCSDRNWTWRAQKGFAGRELAGKICHLTSLYGRLKARSQ